jgi:biopolymer transport protein ExbB
LISIIQAAGWPIWLLIVSSVIALALIIERLYHLRTSRIAPPALIEEVLTVTRTSLPSADVLDKLSQNSELGTVLAAGIRSVAAEPRITEVALRQSIENAGREAVHRTERYLTALGTIASAAPLLGLFGTVVGMIEIFGSQSPSGGTNPAQLAHGISIALYNTAFGIAISIPSLIFYRHFKNKVDGFVVQMEQAASKLIDIVHGEREGYQTRATQS